MSDRLVAPDRDDKPCVIIAVDSGQRIGVRRGDEGDRAETGVIAMRISVSTTVRLEQSLEATTCPAISTFLDLSLCLETLLTSSPCGDLCL